MKVVDLRKSCHDTHLTCTDISCLYAHLTKVVDLRAALGERGLPRGGLKKELVARLMEAM